MVIFISQVGTVNFIALKAVNSRNGAALLIDYRHYYKKLTR